MRPNAKKWSRHRLVLALFFLNSCICIETRFHTDSTLGGVIWKAFYLLRNCNKWVLSCFIYTRGTNRLPEVFRAICVFIFFCCVSVFVVFVCLYSFFIFFIFYFSFLTLYKLYRIVCMWQAVVMTSMLIVLAEGQSGSSSDELGYWPK